MCFKLGKDNIKGILKISYFWERIRSNNFKYEEFVFFIFDGVFLFSVFEECNRVWLIMGVIGKKYVV